MPNLKLAKLPDRRNIKITVTVPPDLDKALKTYAEIYRDSYGDQEEVSTLIPYMLEKFLASDRAFVRAQRTAAEPIVEHGRQLRARPGANGKEEVG